MMYRRLWYLARLRGATCRHRPFHVYDNTDRAIC